MSRALIADISKYQLDFNPAGFRDLGGVSVIVKATMGFGRDHLLDRHAKLTNEAGLVLGLYHWFDPTSTVQRQVDLFRAAIDQYQPAYVWVDIEQWWADWGLWYDAIYQQIPMSAVPVVSDAKQFNLAAAFLTAIQANFTPGRTGIYTGKWFIDRYCPSLRGIVGRYPLWLAEYVSWLYGECSQERLAQVPVILKDSSPKLPSTASQWDLWQVSARVMMPLVCSKNVDINISRREQADFIAWAGGQNDPPAPAKKQVTITALWGLRVREEPNTTSRILKSIPFLGKVWVVDQPGDWLKLADEPGWIHSGWVR